MTLYVSGNIVWADRDPTANDDHDQRGYVKGMQWVNTSTDAVFLCRSDAHAAAVWSEYTGVAVVHKVDAVLPPDADNDSTEGYSTGSLWVDTDANENYICMDPAEGAAVWAQFPAADPIHDADLAGTFAGTMSRTGENAYAVRRDNSAASAPGATNDVTEDYAVFSRWLDTTGPDIYECVDATEDAAVWVAIYTAP